MVFPRGRGREGAGRWRGRGGQPAPTTDGQGGSLKPAGERERGEREESSLSLSLIWGKMQFGSPCGRSRKEGLGGGGRERRLKFSMQQRNRFAKDPHQQLSPLSLSHLSLEVEEDRRMQNDGQIFSSFGMKLRRHGAVTHHTDFGVFFTTTPKRIFFSFMIVMTMRIPTCAKKREEKKEKQQIFLSSPPC